MEKITRSVHLSGPAQTFFGLALAVLVGFVVYVGRGVLIPFVIAAFLCFLIVSLKESVKRLPGIGKHLPNWLCYVVAFGLIIFAFSVFIAIIRTNVGNVLEVWPNYEARLTNLASNLFQWVQSRDFIPQEIIGSVAEIQQAALGMVTPFLRQALGSLGGLTSNFLTLGTVLFYMAFMLIERGRIFKKVHLISAGNNQETAVRETINDIGTLVRQYISVKTITNLITATVSYVIMYFVGVDFAGFWALLIFIFNYIPLFGAALAILMPVSLMIVQPDGGPLKALLLLGLMVGAEQTMSSVIEPRLVGKTLNLSPLVILLSLASWGALWGFTGLLLSIPMTITVMIILTQFRSTRPIAIMLSDNGEIADIKHDDIMTVETKDDNVTQNNPEKKQSADMTSISENPNSSGEDKNGNTYTKPENAVPPSKAT